MQEKVETLGGSEKTDVGSLDMPVGHGILAAVPTKSDYQVYM